jgi:hypothetical protein
MGTEEIAALKGVASVNVRRAIQRGTLKGYEHLGKVVARRSDVENWHPLKDNHSRAQRAAAARWAKEEKEG